MTMGYETRLGQLVRLNASLALAYQKPVFADDYVLCGLLDQFSRAFDSACATMRCVLADGWGVDDFPEGTTRELLSRALYNGLIEDEKSWLSMLRLRSELPQIHVAALDNPSVSAAAARDILERYIPALAAFERDMREVVAGLPKLAPRQAAPPMPYNRWNEDSPEHTKLGVRRRRGADHRGVRRLVRGHKGRDGGRGHVVAACDALWAGGPCAGRGV